jgi:hypothetical protein
VSYPFLALLYKCVIIIVRFVLNSYPSAVSPLPAADDCSAHAAVSLCGQARLSDCGRRGRHLLHPDAHRAVALGSVCAHRRRHLGRHALPAALAQHVEAHSAIAARIARRGHYGNQHARGRAGRSHLWYARAVCAVWSCISSHSTYHLHDNIHIATSPLFATSQPRGSTRCRGRSASSSARSFSASPL